MAEPDLLRWPLIGAFLRWRHARTTIQIALLVAAALVTLHGLLGPQIGSANLATVSIWVHYRGLLVVALLAAGNLFCAGCPFVRVRDWGRRLHAPSLRWPKALRGKWIAILLFVAVLFTYELFDLWSLPRATAWLILAYFAVALAIDLVFTGATFCKHLCPIGQFSFLASTLSPLELRIRSSETCAACQTSDCIAGRRAAAAPQRIVQRGCELGLYLPAKIGNLDCTFCLDCVQACPHDNIALAPRPPGLELADDGRRAGIGRLTARPDLAVLTSVFVFGALVNALGMIAPVSRLERWLAAALGTASEAVVLGVLFATALGVAPLLLLFAAAHATRRMVRDTSHTAAAIAVRHVHALLPLGVSIWTAHLGFHLLTGALAIVPVMQSAALDAFGVALLGEPWWRLAGMPPGAVLPIQVGLIALGTIGSWGLTAMIAAEDYPGNTTRASSPWLVLIAALAFVAAWILFQPMEMRGLGFGA